MPRQIVDLDDADARHVGSGEYMVRVSHNHPPTIYHYRTLIEACRSFDLLSLNLPRGTVHCSPNM